MFLYLFLLIFSCLKASVTGWLGLLSSNTCGKGKRGGEGGSKGGGEEGKWERGEGGE